MTFKRLKIGRKPSEKKVMAWKLLTSFVMTLLLLAELAQARGVTRFYQGARSAGMGGARIAVVNDETALLVNPAGLGKVRDIYGTLLDPEFEGSDNWYELYRTKSFSGLFDPEKLQPSLQESLSTPYRAKAQVFPSFVVRNFGIGLLGRYELDARVDDTGTAMDTLYHDDLALLLGFNFRLWGGRIKLGVTGKFISRIEIDQVLPVSGPLSIDANATEGAAVGADVGLTLTAPWTLLPTLSAVVRDVGGTNFSAGSGLRKKTTSRPNRIAQDIDVAIALFPIHSNNSRSTFTAEFQKITEAAQANDKNRYYHLGYEYNYGDVLFLRTGMNQKYWTAGFEIASENTQVQFAYYGEDVGIDGKSEEQRRWVWKFVYRY